jgi:redox-sensitive bicupin YhaK (pirin superfamily)
MGWSVETIPTFLGFMETLKTIQLKFKPKQNGPIARLISPHDLGEKLKPFIFLDHLNANVPDAFGFGLHPHSGISTLTYQLNVDVNYIDTEGFRGVLKARGLEWMQAGGGAWHGGTMSRGGEVEGFQLWVSLPPEVEDSKSFSLYVEPEKVPRSGPLSVLLGSYGELNSLIKTPSEMNYFYLDLKASQRFDFEVPSNHSISWAFIHRGQSVINDELCSGDFLVFNGPGNRIVFQAQTDSQILFGSAVPHNYDLVTGYYSVHTNKNSLKMGEQKIQELGKNLKS